MHRADNSSFFENCIYILVKTVHVNAAFRDDLIAGTGKLCQLFLGVTIGEAGTYFRNKRRSRRRIVNSARTTLCSAHSSRSLPATILDERVPSRAPTKSVLNSERRKRLRSYRSRDIPVPALSLSAYASINMMLIAPYFAGGEHCPTVTNNPACADENSSQLCPA